MKRWFVHALLCPSNINTLLSQRQRTTTTSATAFLLRRRAAEFRHILYSCYSHLQFIQFLQFLTGFPWSLSLAIQPYRLCATGFQ
ncbi:unnamed protein product [Citrullus colocynthis]|uniref:Secreted protein n=1 Tax=Citrullus colocynthis TaxID=252529 RepID=A0ABP0ZGM4_9ROSI